MHATLNGGICIHQKCCRTNKVELELQVEAEVDVEVEVEVEMEVEMEVEVELAEQTLLADFNSWKAGCERLAVTLYLLQTLHYMKYDLKHLLL